MLDFLLISTRSSRRGVIEIYPKFIIKKSKDLMIRGRDFYAIWDEEQGLWSSDEQDVIRLIDSELDAFVSENKHKFEATIKVLYMWDAETGMIDFWHKYCQKQMRDCFHSLDSKLIFANTKVKKKDYSSHRLPYPLEPGDYSSFEKLISTLYSETERHKIEWAIGSIITGDSKTIQKFIVLYGSAGTGKGTMINIIEKLFEGYYAAFDAKALGSSSDAFALEAFKSNPLVAIQHDGDLSKIEDNTRLNSLISHEIMTVNEKFKPRYSNRYECLLFIGTNKPVKITDAKSGIIRRLIDVSPAGTLIDPKEYKALMKKIEFELGAIACHCRDVYLESPNAYDDYIPVNMLGATNDFYNFILDSYQIFKDSDGISLKSAWEMYKTYCDEAKVQYALPQRAFKEELRNYFEKYKERYNTDDGLRIRSYYSGFKTKRFEAPDKNSSVKKQQTILFNSTRSIFDIKYADIAAQYASPNETPLEKWDNVKTSLSEIDTTQLHYVRPPLSHIVIDFDLVENGEKSLERNIEEASKWPCTYAELSKSGKGVHLHYIYTGDTSKLSRVYDEFIEIKVFTGNSSLRRKITKCNDLPIASISSGLPLKGESKVVNNETIKSERGLRYMIKKNLSREIHPNTKPSIDFISKILDDAYKNGLHYDISDMRNAILAFAASSTNQSEYCIKQIPTMKFKSEDVSTPVPNASAGLVFYDVEVFPNLFLVCWKLQGEENPVVTMINPTPAQIEDLIKYRLVGFNCRRYDNHILYARLMGYTNEQLYNLSQKIITGSPNCFFGEAYNISYTDIYDFSSTKQSLKKFEIELKISHVELGLPWDKPVPEELWPTVASYCNNDVIATEKVFDARQGDFIARQILADLAGMTVNDTTNTLTTRIIFGNDRKPQSQFNYRDLSDVSQGHNDWVLKDNWDLYSKYGDEYTVFDDKGRPIFPGYKFENGVSTYRGEVVGEGGNVYAEPGMYYDVPVLDIVSMHPHSAIAEKLFGEEYTKRFEDIVKARIAIKHKDFESARQMLGGALAKYLTDESTAKELATALKIAINSVYGLTMANFNTPFRDIRNKDNLVAKRGALFMINLKHEVQRRGYTVAHIKTDSIKIPNANPDIINVVVEYGKLYGYTFEHEDTYEKFCLVNDAVYVAKGKDGKWTATGAQFRVPYVFKTLFSKEELIFDDFCETKAVTSSLYLDMNEQLPDVTLLEKERARLIKKGENVPNDLINKIDAGHNYIFVGRVGQFCPIKKGCGGGELMREIINKKTGEVSYAYATGSKGYRWMEAEMVKTLEKEKDINRDYYDRLVNEAVNTLSKYGDIEWFINGSVDKTPPPWKE